MTKNKFIKTLRSWRTPEPIIKNYTNAVAYYGGAASYDDIYNAIYIPSRNVFMYRSENIMGCYTVNLSRYYYLTDRRNETDTYYKNLARHFFRKRYELT